MTIIIIINMRGERETLELDSQNASFVSMTISTPLWLEFGIKLFFGMAEVARCFACTRLCCHPVHGKGNRRVYFSQADGCMRCYEFEAVRKDTRADCCDQTKPETKDRINSL